MRSSRNIGRHGVSYRLCPYLKDGECSGRILEGHRSIDGFLPFDAMQSAQAKVVARAQPFVELLRVAVTALNDAASNKHRGGV